MIEQKLEQIGQSYPKDMIEGQLSDIPRIAFNIRLALNGQDPKGLSVCDIGGGVGLFSVGCAALGMSTTLVDDFADPVNLTVGDAPLKVHKKYGVQIVARDVVKHGLPDMGPFDIITTFDSMEHWHHSPKALFRQIREKLLKPGGRFVLGVPNCVNLRKRISVPLGIGKWSAMAEWYEEESFRGHVREPDVSDLRYIAKDMKLEDTQVIGRNWLGYQSRYTLARKITPLVDRLIRPIPSLCSDIYLVGQTSAE